MKISKAIQSVLEKNHQVGLPGLGLLLKQRVEGFYDNEQQILYPPKIVTTFSEDQYADGSEVVQLLKVDFSSEGSAKIALEQYLEDLVSDLDAGSDVEIEGVGFFYKNHDQLIFKPQAQADFYGLPELHVEAVTIPTEKAQGEQSMDELVPEQIAEPEEEEIKAAANPLEEEVVEMINPDQNEENTADSVENLSISDTTEQETEDISQLSQQPEPAGQFSLAEQAMSAVASDEELIEQHSKSKIWLYILLPILIIGVLLAAVYFIRPDVYDQLIQKLAIPKKETKIIQTPPVVAKPELSVDSAIADSIYSEDIEKGLQEQGLDYEKVKDSADVSVKTSAVPNEHNIRYEIIVAAWQTREKAENHVKKLKAAGIDAHIVEDADGTLIKISVATFYDLKPAEKEIDRVRREINPQAFIKPIKTLK